MCVGNFVTTEQAASAGVLAGARHSRRSPAVREIFVMLMKVAPWSPPDARTPVTPSIISKSGPDQASQGIARRRVKSQSVSRRDSLHGL
jgi:hypothetical protein